MVHDLWILSYISPREDRLTPALIFFNYENHDHRGVFILSHGFFVCYTIRGGADGHWALAQGKRGEMGDGTPHFGRVRRRLKVKGSSSHILRDIQAFWDFWWVVHFFCTAFCSRAITSGGYGLSCGTLILKKYGSAHVSLAATAAFHLTCGLGFEMCFLRSIIVLVVTVCWGLPFFFSCN